METLLVKLDCAPRCAPSQQLAGSWGGGGAESSPQNVRTFLLYLPCPDVPQLWALQWMSQMYLHVSHSKHSLRSGAQPFRNQISCGMFCSVLANTELSNQVFPSGILETNLRDGVGCSWVSCTHPMCKWGAVVWPSHTKSLIVSSWFCKTFQHQCLRKLFGIFSCPNPVPLTRLFDVGFAEWGPMVLWAWRSTELALQG